MSFAELKGNETGNETPIFVTNNRLIAISDAISLRHSITYEQLNFIKFK